MWVIKNAAADADAAAAAAVMRNRSRLEGLNGVTVVYIV